MAAIPDARSGIVFRYRYLRIWEYERGDQVGKDRPCCILMPLRSGQILEAPPIQRERDPTAMDAHTVDEGEVLILPIQSDPPGQNQLGLELTIQDKRYVGLPSHAPSYVLVSEANLDRWPNADMSLVPGRQGTFTYDRPLAGPVIARILRAFLMAHRTGKLAILVRHP